MSNKALFAIVAALDLELHRLDIKTAFQYCAVTEDVYVEQPCMFVKSTGKVCKLKRALYGLKQAPRIWYSVLSDFLKSLGFEPLSADSCVFTKAHIIIAIFVDDLLIAASNVAQVNEVKTVLSNRFPMSDLGECAWYLGIKVERNR
jgi:hypothetical protein